MAFPYSPGDVVKADDLNYLYTITLPANTPVLARKADSGNYITVTPGISLDSPLNLFYQKTGDEATDGDLTTESTTTSYTIDLGEEKNAKLFYAYIRVYDGSSSSATGYKSAVIYGSNDNSTWTQLGSFTQTEHPGIGKSIYWEGSVSFNATYRYFKVDLEGSTSWQTYYIRQYALIGW